MLAIKINSNFIDLSPETSVPVTLVNPVFDIENIERTFSYPFTIPLTTHNRRIFEHTNRLDIATRSERYIAEMWINGEVFERGVIEVQSATNSTMSIVFKNDSIRLKEKMALVKLTDLDLPVIEYTTPFAPIYTFHILMVHVDPGITEIVITINSTFIYGPIADFPAFVNAINLSFPGMAAVVNDDGVSKDMTLDSSVVENFSVLLRGPVPSGFSDYTYFDSITSDITSEVTRINAAFDTHAQSLQDGAGTHVFAPVYAPNIYDGKNPDFLGYINNLDESNYNTQSDIEAVDAIAPKWLYTWAPQIFIREVLTAIGTEFDLLIEGEFEDDEDLNKLVLFSNSTLDFLATPSNGIKDVRTPGFVNIPATSYNLADHVPDIDCFAFLQYLQTTFPLFFRLKDNKIIIKSRKAKLNTPIKNWTTYFDPEYNKNFSEFLNYTLNYDRYSDETEITGMLEDLDGGSDARTYTSKWWTLYEATRGTTEPIYRTWKTTEYNQKGFSVPAGMDEPQKPILLFYRGMQNDAFDNAYPLATHSSTNFDEEEIGTYSLDWNGATGRYEQLWKEIIELETKGQDIDMIALIPITVLRELKQNWNAKISIYSPDGQLTGFIKSISFEAGERGVGLAKVKIIKI